MENMENIIAEYKKLLEELYVSKDNYNDEGLVIFSPGKGKYYNNKLMVYGRAVNDWKNYFNKQDNTEISLVLDEVKNSLETDTLDWVFESWGVNDGRYNTKKSAFWRVVWKVSGQIFEDEINPVSKIVWSNIYKAAPSGGGNPSSLLKDVQFENCLEIMKLELEIFNPEYIVFFTDYYGWAEPFINRLPVQVIEQNNEGYIKLIGIYNGIKIIIAQHPQGKPEQEHVDAILEANKRFK